MKLILTLLAIIFLNTSTWAADCVFEKNESVCGIPISSDREHFLDKLGKPDGEISMGNNRVGYFYGPHILLIFQENKLWEVDGWEVNPNIDFWTYVSNDKKRDSMRLVFKKWSPWGLMRSDVEKHDEEFPLDDADGSTESRKAGTSSMMIFYAPCYAVNSICKFNDYETFQVNKISISFHSVGH